MRHRIHIRSFCFLALFASLTLVPLWGNAQYTEAKRVEKHIKKLASDRMKGRGTGTPEQEQAVRYIEKEFERYGLTPAGDEGYRQPFAVTTRRGDATDLRSKNVVGFLDNGAEQTIIVGAHYDHVGLGQGRGSSRAADQAGEVHNGADDNASGVAGLLELARHYSRNDETEPFNVLFIAFGAEELGLLGARHYVSEPTRPLDEVVLMVNCDMIGRYRDSIGVQIYTGADTTGWGQTLEQTVPEGLNYELRPENRRLGSDHKPFERAEVPVLWMFTGLHDDYHTPVDDLSTLNIPAMPRILDFTIRAINSRFER